MPEHIEPPKPPARRRRWRPTILAVLALPLVVVLVLREMMLRQNIALTTDALSRFTAVPGLGYFEEARPQFSAGADKPFQHAVLVLHGYSASPEELNELTKALHAAGMPYYAPLLTGYGLEDFRLLYEIQASDWLRDAENAYTIMAALAEEVSVVSHSSGGNMAIYLASHHPVKHLVMVGPNLIPSPSDTRYKQLSNTPLLGDLMAWLVPVFAKPKRPGRSVAKDTLDPVAASKSFHYPALPSQSLRAQWDMQDLVDIRQARFQDLSILYGEQDVTVDNEAALARLDQYGIPYSSYVYANSGHNVLQDYEKERAVQDIMAILSKP